MTPEEQIELVKRHYALNASGDYAAAEDLLTDDFVITIPSFLPFAGVYRGKKAFRELIPRVVESLAVVKIKSVATTVGDDHAVEVVEFTFAGDDAVTVQNTEVIRFCGQQICEIRPFYHDPVLWIAAAARLKAARDPGSSASISS